MDLTDFIEEKLNKYAQEVIERGAKADEHALGELTFYMALRRVISGNATMQDIGMLDAINDTLQTLGLVESRAAFYNSTRSNQAIPRL